MPGSAPTTPGNTRPKPCGVPGCDVPPAQARGMREEPPARSLPEPSTGVSAPWDKQRWLREWERGRCWVGFGPTPTPCMGTDPQPPWLGFLSPPQLTLHVVLPPLRHPEPAEPHVPEDESALWRGNVHPVTPVCPLVQVTLASPCVPSDSHVPSHIQ